MSRLRFSLLAFALLPAAGFCQIRVVTWNITNWSTTESVTRMNGLLGSMYGSFQGRQMAPDVLCLQEVETAGGLNNILNALNNWPGSPGDWASAPFVTGPDTQSVFLYRTGKVQFLGVTTIANGGASPNGPRNTNRYDIRPVGFPVNSATLSIYNVHFKSSTSSDDELRRETEANAIRANAESLQDDRHFMVVGDLNTQKSTDKGYVALVGSRPINTGRFFDPISTPGSGTSGTWYQINSMRFVHTQDPWNSATAGGMDDRFDFLLCSSGLLDGEGLSYIGNYGTAYSTTTWNDPNHSYRSWGNDGSTFNSPMNVATNAMVGPAIAQSLIDSLGNQSGHLPVFLDLRVPPRMQVSTSYIDFGYVDGGRNSVKSIEVLNTGALNPWVPSGVSNLNYSITRTSGSGFSTPVGPFSDPATTGGQQHGIAIDTSTPGRKTAIFTVTSNDPITPTFEVMVTGVVVRNILRR